MATLVITPLIKAETWLGAAGCASGSQTWRGTSPAFGAGADESEDQDDGGKRAAAGADVGKSVTARPTREQSKGQQQRQRAEAGHQDVNIGRLPMVWIMMVREHERPGGDGHQLPGKQEAETIVGKHDEVHAGNKQGIEGEDTARRCLVPTMADGKEAGGSPPS
jgi:hypothetical protein